MRDYIIAPRGDAILEFANTGAHDAETPVLRFRVSSHMLSETSPVFSRLFSSSSPSSSPSSSTPAYEATWHDEDDDGPCPPPRPVVLPDNSTAKLYAMPQHEPNAHSALTILLHAAHMHTDARYVPRAIGDFAQFVAIAETCLRYRCTSPLEVFVEHCWLPAWVHRAWTGDRPDGLLVISYAFGLRRLFARVSKSAVLGVVDEEELAAKGWPRRVKERYVPVYCFVCEVVSYTSAFAPRGIHFWRLFQGIVVGTLGGSAHEECSLMLTSFFTHTEYGPSATRN